MKLPIGDTHNFGKYTSAKKCEDGWFYIKPRPVYWEYLFFGKSSPLKSIFKKNPELDTLCSMINLDVYSSPMASDVFPSGKVRLIRRTRLKTFLSRPGNDALLARQFGALCAYSFFFGIADLHLENAILSDEGLQPVDVECVFIKNKYLSNSCLISANSSDKKSDISLSATLKSFVKKKPQWILNLLFSAYVDTLFGLMECATDIKVLLKKADLNINRMPIRSILRPTDLYFFWRAMENKISAREKPLAKISFKKKFFPHRRSKEARQRMLLINSDLISEELVQLKRGEVPYFFTFLGDSRIYYLTSEKNLHPKHVHKLRNVDLKAVIAVKDLGKLFHKTRVIKEGVHLGLIELAWDLLPRDFTGSFEWKQIKMVVSKEKIQIKDVNSNLMTTAGRFSYQHILMLKLHQQMISQSKLRRHLRHA